MNFCGKFRFELINDKNIPPKKDHHPQSYTPKLLADKMLGPTAGSNTNE
jgi:hypothetical protein